MSKYTVGSIQGPDFDEVVSGSRGKAGGGARDCPNDTGMRFGHCTEQVERSFWVCMQSHI